MLFIQIITMKYDKKKRSGDTMRRINSVRFIPLPGSTADLSAGDILLHDSRLRKARVFPMDERLRISDRVHVLRCGDDFRVVYTRRPEQQFFKPVFTVRNGEYGRLVYNERGVTFDGEWYYIRTTINFISAGRNAYREKMFFRKETDHLFEDMAYLWYC